MVGLNSLGLLLLGLLALSACVPQTKQTKCSSNEAFNTTTRSCVPVLASSKINVESYDPIYALTKYKSDTSLVTLSITVSNPFGLNYKVKWKRTFGGVSDYPTMGPDQLELSISPNYYGTILGQIGTHLFTAVITDMNDTIVYDTHAFNVSITADPLPIIDSATIVPGSYTVLAPLASDATEFSFSIKNNGANLTLGLEPRIQWSVIKNGSILAAPFFETDIFSDISQFGVHAAYYGTALVKRFDPSHATLGVGNYVIQARMTDSTGLQTWATQQWSVTVKHPDFGKVSTVSSPAPGVAITAHNNINYTQFPAVSWIFGTPASQPDFCVELANPSGAYAADAKGVQIKYYLDGVGTEICTKETSDVTTPETVCLTDPAFTCAGGVPFDPTLLVFTNTQAFTTEPHKVTARLFDKASGIEFDAANMQSGAGSYPVQWAVNVKPANTAPVLGFGTTQPTGCVTDTTYVKKDCAVTQGTPFTVSFTVTDEYDAAVNPEHFQWTVIAKYNGTDIVGQSCTRAFGDTTLDYGTQWTCTLSIPHSISTGPLDPSVGNYTVVAALDDDGSVVAPGAGLAATNLTWKLKVTEANTSGIVLGAQAFLNTESHIKQGVTTLDPANPASYATELQTINFNLKVTDNEYDNFKYRISLCTTNTAACPTSSVITTPAYVDFIRSLQTVPMTNPVIFNGLLYTLPENLLLMVTPIQDVATTAAAVREVHFKVEVEDAPSVPLAAPADTDFKIFKLYVRNYNPAPVISGAGASPAVGSTTEVYSGYPITIDPGTVTDASSVGSGEETITYQWYAKTGAGAWTAITGATERLLRWTPGNITTSIDLKLCAGDRPLANPATLLGVCSGTWTVTPKKYLTDLLATGLNEVDKVSASWYDEFNATANTEVFYSAFLGDDKRIYVEKTVKSAAGTMVTASTSFDALPTIATGEVTNISITGTLDSLYVAYIASSLPAPTIMTPQVRRIDKSFTATENKSGLSHPAPFGYNYSHYILSGTCIISMTCSKTDGDGIGGFATITFANRLATGETLTINNTTFTAGPAPTTAPLAICDASACADVNSMAANVAAKINSSALADLQGIRAFANGANVELYGQYHNDYQDFSTQTVLAGGLGKIFISGGNWYLPFINSSLAGVQQNNVTVITGPVDQHLKSFIPTASNVLLEMGKTAQFDARLNNAGTELVIARISGELSDAGALSLFRYELSGGVYTIIAPVGTAQNELPIFGTHSFESVKLATDNDANAYLYVLAKEKTVNGGEYHIGRYSPLLASDATPAEDFLSTRLVTTDSTDDVISDTKLLHPEIISVPGFTEARIFFHSVGLGATPYPRVARWKSDNSVTCGGCDSLTADAYQPGAQLGISQVGKDVVLGAAGAVPLQNSRDIVVALFSTDLAAGGLYKPQLGIINIQAEAIQSTTVDPTGLWRPPFVKD